MKKVAGALMLIFGIVTSSFAQTETKEKMSAEQKTTLQLKKLTLELNLTSAQQKELEPLLAEQSKKRELKQQERKAKKDSKTKLTKDQKFDLMNKNLDEQIAFKAKISKILNAEQMQKWESLKEKRKSKMQKIKKVRKQDLKQSKEVSK
jgi:periplasmic protein CpxP/Spy